MIIQRRLSLILIHVVLTWGLFEIGGSPTINDDPLVVETTKGWIKGFRDRADTSSGEALDCWFGIPYAEPPVGNLRFQHPQAKQNWTGIRKTQDKPNSCVQLVDDFFPGFEGAAMWNPNTQMSEDCLYLNVVAPSNRKEKLPVMIWVYGGGFYSGTSTLDVYNPLTLAATENVIVVSMQYRVASLGFLYFGTPEAPGNTGLFDQLMALRFVKENIERFGGDPENITLFGESAGAAGVSMHLVSPLSRELFNRAILQSGSATSKWAVIPQEESIRRGLRLAKTVNCTHDATRLSDVVTCLRSKNASELVRNEWGDMGLFQFPFVPVVDKAFLLELPEESIRHNRFKETNLLLGTNKDEGMYFLLYYLPDVFRKADNVHVTRELFLDSVRRLHPTMSEIGRDAIAFEYTDWVNAYDTERNRDNLDQIVGDQHITCDVNELASRYADSGNFVYQYYFTHRSSQHPWPSWTGVMHADEISFVFGKPLNPSRGYAKEEVDLSRLMMRYWANFARTGNPNILPNGSWNKIYWPVHTVYGKEYLELHSNASRASKVSRGLKANHCAFWKSFLPELIQSSSTNSTQLETSNTAKIKMEDDIDANSAAERPTETAAFLITFATFVISLPVRV